MAEAEGSHDQFGTSQFETLTPAKGMLRFPALDGWRGISILLVIAGHLFPLGVGRLELNAAVAALGMAIFFTLSGFLITTTLLVRPSVVEFLIRRFCRILPLAWVFTIVVLSIENKSPSFFFAQMFFYSNLPPFWLTDPTGHLWSLCVEMQFYVGIACVVWLFGKRGLWSIPVLALFTTAARIHTHTYISIITSYRVDEILAGGTLALMTYYDGAHRVKTFISRINPSVLLALALLASHTAGHGLNYARPYLVAAMVGSTLFTSRSTFAGRVLGSRWLAYIAAISYALYIFHALINWGWLASGSKLVKYAKRIPELAVVFGLAHLSTFYYENFWIRKGKQWSRQLSAIWSSH